MDGQKDRHTVRKMQTAKQAGRWADKQIGGQADSQTGKQSATKTRADKQSQTTTHRDRKTSEARIPRRKQARMQANMQARNQAEQRRAQQSKAGKNPEMEFRLLTVPEYPGGGPQPTDNPRSTRPSLSFPRQFPDPPPQVGGGGEGRPFKVPSPGKNL